MQYQILTVNLASSNSEKSSNIEKSSVPHGTAPPHPVISRAASLSFAFSLPPDRQFVVVNGRRPAIGGGHQWDRCDGGRIAAGSMRRRPRRARCDGSRRMTSQHNGSMTASIRSASLPQFVRSMSRSRTRPRDASVSAFHAAIAICLFFFSDIW